MAPVFLPPRLILWSAALFLAACGSPRGPDQPPPSQPRVLMPSGLNGNEEKYIPQVEAALERHGFKPTLGRDAEYKLGFSLDSGPINADARLELTQGRQNAARSFARVGGPRIIFQRGKVIREAFEKALADFDGQLAQAASGGAGAWDAAPDSRPADSSPDDFSGDGYNDAAHQGTPYQE